MLESGFGAMLALAGAIMVLGAAGGVVWKWTAPVRETRRFAEKTREDHAARIGHLEEMSLRDYERFRAQERYDRVVMTALIALLDHTGSGDLTGAVKEARTELGRFLIER